MFRTLPPVGGAWCLVMFVVCQTSSWQGFETIQLSSPKPVILERIWGNIWVQQINPGNKCHKVEQCLAATPRCCSARATEAPGAAQDYCSWKFAVDFKRSAAATRNRWYSGPVCRAYWYLPRRKNCDCELCCTRSGISGTDVEAEGIVYTTQWIVDSQTSRRYQLLQFILTVVFILCVRLCQSITTYNNILSFCLDFSNFSSGPFNEFYFAIRPEQKVHWCWCMCIVQEFGPDSMAFMNCLVSSQILTQTAMARTWASTTLCPLWQQHSIQNLDSAGFRTILAVRKTKKNWNWKSQVYIDHNSSRSTDTCAFLIQLGSCIFWLYLHFNFMLHLALENDYDDDLDKCVQEQALSVRMAAERTRCLSANRLSDSDCEYTSNCKHRCQRITRLVYEATAHVTLSTLQVYSQWLFTCQRSSLTGASLAVCGSICSTLRL